MNHIADEIGKVVAYIREQGSPVPHYIYGHRVEIAKRLSGKNKVNEKYPLIALRLDIPEKFYGGVYHYKLNILIVDFTKTHYNAEQRYESIIKPILTPIFIKFMDALSDVGGFSWKSDEQAGSNWPPHIKVDRPYWGITEKEGNVRNIFTDPLDAIEIIDLEINQRLKTC